MAKKITFTINNCYTITASNREEITFKFKGQFENGDLKGELKNGEFINLSTIGAFADVEEIECTW